MPDSIGSADPAGLIKGGRGISGIVFTGALRSVGRQGAPTPVGLTEPVLW